MANSSISSSLRSFNDSSIGYYTEEQEMALYTSIKMNLQDIQKITHNINLKLKNVQEKMYTTLALINAIDTKASASNQD